MTWIPPQYQGIEELQARFAAIFKTAAVSVLHDFGTTWYDPQFICTQTGISAIPGSAVPGCMVPGLLSAAFLAGA